MEIRILSMHLKNFKREKDRFIDLQGRNADISSANGLGKTTLYDAFLWVFSDKDSTNRKDFSIKTLDSNGQEIHGLEHEVILNLWVDGVTVKLKKLLVEKWTKKRGEATPLFTGHETKYWIDDVPVPKNVYVKRIGDMASEELFKLLTNLYYFNLQLGWKDRRDMLVKVCGDLTDADVIASNNDLFYKLPEILKGKPVDDHKTMIAERIKLLNIEVGKIPVRIDELNNTLLSDKVDYSTTEAGLADFNSQLNAIELELLGASMASQAIQGKQQRLLRLERDIGVRKIELEKQANSGLEEYLKEKRQLEQKRLDLSHQHSMNEKNLAAYTSENSRLEEEKQALRIDWNAVNQVTLHIEDSTNEFICPTCKRPLPPEDIEAKKKWMQENFENNKAQELAAINAKGKAKKARQDELAALIKSIEERAFKIEVSSREMAERIAEIDKTLSTYTQGPVDYSSDPALQQMEQECAALKAELDKPIETKHEELLQRKRDIMAHIADLNRILSQREVDQKTMARIKELKDEERKLAQQIADAEKEKFLIEQFVRAKMDLLEEKINSRFKTVKFKLFDVQINGGISECCETLVDGVPFADANHAAKINSGIDIINTLSEHFGLKCPLWIDNAEAVNELAETAGQRITLSVPPSFDNLDSTLKALLIKEAGGDAEKAKAAWKEKTSKLRVDAA